MTITNIIILISALAITLYGIVLTAIYVKREIGLHLRSKVNYSNYYKMKKYFNLTISREMIILECIYVVLDLTIMVFMFNRPAITPYLGLLISTLVFNGLGFTAYMTSKGFTRELKEFDELHESIESSFKNKERLVQNIKNLENRIKDVKNEIHLTYSKLNNLVIDFKELHNIDECFIELKKVHEDQENTLNTFDNKMPMLFTKSIILYLENGGVATAKTRLFNPDMSLDIEPLIKDALDILEAKYLAYINDSFLNKMYRDGQALEIMANDLAKNKLFKEEHVAILVDCVNNDPDKNKNIVALLFTYKLVNYEIAKSCLKNKKDWIFDYPLGPCLANKEYAALVEDIVKMNNSTVTNKFLIYADKTIIDLIKKGLAALSIENEASRIISRYIELLELDGSFNSESNRYENMAFALKEFYYSMSEVNPRITAVINNNYFYESKKVITDLYSDVYERLEPIFNKTFNSMLYFSLYCSDKVDYFQQNKINAIYVDYKRRLNAKGLLTLAALLDAIAIVNIKNPNQLNEVLMNIDNVKDVKHFTSYYPSTTNKVKNIGVYSHEIIQLLSKNNESELSTIVNHIEVNRLTLDKIRNI